MKLLLVDACISQRGGDSRTWALADTFVKTFCACHGGTEVEVVPSETLLALQTMDASFLKRRDALAAAGTFDAPEYALARQFAAADGIVVAAPFWDLCFPAALHAYVERISANGIAYHYDAQGCHGDCAAKWLVYLTSGGDVEREGSIGVNWWRQLSAMFGIGRFEYVFAGGLDLDPARAPALAAAGCDQARALAEKL